NYYNAIALLLTIPPSEKPKNILKNHKKTDKVLIRDLSK
ncbi:MAG: hypothetical protein ACI9S8_001167, partial [Chlamydiales bacterium]